MILRVLIVMTVLGSDFTSPLFAGTERGGRLIDEAAGAIGIAGVAGPAGSAAIAGAAGAAALKSIPGIPGALVYWTLPIFMR